MKKNVLIISYSYPPNNVAGAQRPYALAKYLDKTKYNVTVITCQNPDLPIGINENFDPSLDGVELVFVKSKVGNVGGNLRSDNKKQDVISSFFSRIKTILFRIGQSLIFPDKGIFWYYNVKTFLRKNNELIRNIDIIFSTSPVVTNHQIAYFIKRKNKKIEWIADFRDFNYVEHWQFKKGIKAFLHKKLEYSIIKESTYLTFVTQTMQFAYQNFYPHYQNKMYCVYNGLEKIDFPNVSHCFDKKLTFFYAGSFYNGLRSPFPFLQLLDNAFKNNILQPDEVELQIAGTVDEVLKFEMKRYKSFECVVFLGNLPRAEVVNYMCKATFLWLIVANIKTHYQTIPIKLFEYIAARRPIVNFAPIASESSQIIQEKQLGYNFDTLNTNLNNDHTMFLALVNKYREGQYNSFLPNENLEAFTWEKQMQKINDLI